MGRELQNDSRLILSNIRSLNRRYGRTEYLALLYLHMINNYGQSKAELSEIIPLVENEKLRERLQHLISEQLWRDVRFKLNSVNSKNIVEYWNAQAVINDFEIMEKIYYSVFEKAANCVKSNSVLTNLMLPLDFIDKTLSINVSMICADIPGSDYNYTRYLLEIEFNSYCIKLLPITESEYQTSSRKFDKIILNLRNRLKKRTNKKFYSDMSNVIFEAMDKLNKTNPQSRLGVIVEKEYLFNENNKDLISYLIEEKLLEKILIIKQRRFLDETANCYMLVIAGDRLKAKEVEFTDLTGIDYKEYFAQTRISQLPSDIECYYEAQRYFADYDVIKKYNYDINPYHYISIHTEGIRLEDFIINLERGRVLSARDLEEYKSDMTTKFKYLKQSDICDGIISENLTSLKYIPDNMRAYTLKENNIVLSKKIKRGFAAVVHDIGDTEIIAEQNLLVLQVDTERIDPWFLAAYLNIEEYPKLIKTTKQLSFSKIENIVVSIPKDKTTQKALGKKYKNMLIALKRAYAELDRVVKDVYKDNEWFNL